MPGGSLCPVSNYIIQMKKEFTLVQLLDLVNHALDVEISKKEC